MLLIAILIMMAYSLVMIRVEPYKMIDDDRMSFISTLALTLTSLAGLVLIMNSNKYFSAETISTILIVINSTVMLVNVVFIIAIKGGLKQRFRRNKVVPVQGPMLECGGGGGGGGGRGSSGSSGGEVRTWQ